MSSALLTFEQVAAVVIFAVVLASSDPAALSRIGETALAKRAGLKPREIRRFEAATEGESPDPKSESEKEDN